MKKALLLLLVSVATYAQPNIGTPNDIAECDTDGDGYATFDLSQNTATVLNSLNASLYTVTYHETYELAEENTDAVNDQAYVNSNSYNQQIYVRLTENADTDNFSVAYFSIIANLSPIAGDVTFATAYDTTGNGLATFDLTSLESIITEYTGTENYEVAFYTSQVDAISGSPSISTPQAYVSATATVIYYRLENTETGCYTVGSFETVVLAQDYVTLPPAGNTTQTFTEGETLANLEVEGENIQWYATATGDNPLSITTVLENATTYYASQTVYNIESAQRLAVTVSETLNTVDFNALTIAIYPNPASDLLTITSNTTIDTVVLYNLLGQEVLAQNVADNKARINIQALAHEVYIVKIQSGTKLKSIRVVKQ